MAPRIACSLTNRQQRVRIPLRASLRSGSKQSTYFYIAASSIQCKLRTGIPCFSRPPKVRPPGGFSDVRKSAPQLKIWSWFYDGDFPDVRKVAGGRKVIRTEVSPIEINSPPQGESLFQRISHKYNEHYMLPHCIVTQCSYLHVFFTYFYLFFFLFSLFQRISHKDNEHYMLPHCIVTQSSYLPVFFTYFYFLVISYFLFISYLQLILPYFIVHTPCGISELLIDPLLLCRSSKFSVVVN